jgi:hypothetical protein
MPNHVHLLTEGQSEDSDGKIITHKQLSGFHFKKHSPASGCGNYS